MEDEQGDTEGEQDREETKDEQGGTEVEEDREETKDEQGEDVYGVGSKGTTELQWEIVH